ncbi:MAG: T9SS type A sorting domain-containing protein [Ferruginibacter sp.]
MKKLLLLAILLASFNSIFAEFTTQGSWRWRKDDGSQTTATWIAAQNVVPVISSTADLLRLRIELYNDPLTPGGTLTDALFEDSSDAPGAHWDTIKLAADADDPFILAGSSPNVVNLAPTTQQLSAPHYTTFQAGKVIVSSEKLPSSTVGDNGGTEYEYVIKPTLNLQPSTTYYFRVDAANYVTGRPLPSLTTAATLPVQLSGFSVKKEGKKVGLYWSTSSEQNNDRFEAERSNDGRTWSTIATVKGNGTSNAAHTYDSYDLKPVNGINYYRLKQYDLDGRYVLSATKSLKFDAHSVAIISVLPNPVKGAVNFKLDIDATNVSAIFSDGNGKVINKEIFKNLQANTVNKLNLKQQPAAGVYILKLQGEGISESIKVVVQ